jgi:hypothetical protein
VILLTLLWTFCFLLLKILLKIDDIRIANSFQRITSVYITFFCKQNSSLNPAVTDLNRFLHAVMKQAVPHDIIKMSKLSFGLLPLYDVTGEEELF